MYVFILHFWTDTPWYGIATAVDGDSTNFKAFVSEVSKYSWRQHLYEHVVDLGHYKVVHYFSVK